MSERKPYKTDLSDAQWALIEPVIVAWKAAHPSVSGHQGRYEMREIVNALLYRGRTGCQWDLLPHDLPPRGAVMYYFTKWRDDGTYQTIHDLLRWQVREKARRNADPSLVVLDTQSVHAAAGVPAGSTGCDAAKKYRGASAAWPLTCWACWPAHRPCCSAATSRHRPPVTCGARAVRTGWCQPHPGAQRSAAERRTSAGSATPRTTAFTRPCWGLRNIRVRSCAKRPEGRAPPVGPRGVQDWLRGAVGVSVQEARRSSARRDGEPASVL